METHHSLIERAIKLAGSQQKLAEKIGLSQQGVSWLLNESNAVSAEIAIKIDRAFDGKIPKEKIRPDIFGKTA